MSERVRLATVETDDGPRAVVVLDDGVLHLREALPGAPDDVRGLIRDWGAWGGPVAAAVAERGPGTVVPFGQVRWLAPVVPRKVLCVGSNYHDHIQEMTGPAGLPVRPAPFPFSFLKPPTALVGSGRDVPYPAFGRKLDWEAELAVVIGDAAAAGGPDPLAAVFGYTMLNDLSLRDFIPFPHTLGLDAVVSKGFDGAAPIGPWITLASDIADPQNLPIELRINGDVQQDGSTASMVFSVRELVAHYARILTLEPGDVIATGTPAGVGAARRPPRYLTAGDVVEVRIGELGRLHTTIVDGAPQDLLATEVPA